jgi:predicted aldo/keto reductase-like oxidoreductase
VEKLTEKDHSLIKEASDAYKSLAPIPCTQCEYCLPCPSGVAIPSIFEIYNDAVAFDARGNARWAYNNQIKPESWADQCVECGDCEAVCPQQIEIIDWLAQVHKELAQPEK